MTEISIRPGNILNLKTSRKPEHQARVKEEYERTEKKFPGLKPEIIHHIARDRVAQHIVRERIRARERYAFTDELTGLPNKRQFNKDLDLAIATSNRSHTSLRIIVADIDRFKEVNTQFGYLNANEALKAIARIHTRLGETFHRWGGDEFVLIFNHNTPIEELRVILARYNDEYNKLVGNAFGSMKPQSNYHGPVNRRPTLSFGIAEYIPGESGESLFSRASGVLSAKDKRNSAHLVSAPDEHGNTILQELDLTVKPPVKTSVK